MRRRAFELAIAVLLCSVQLVQSQVVDDGGDYNSQIDNPEVLSLFHRGRLQPPLEPHHHHPQRPVHQKCQLLHQGSVFIMSPTVFSGEVWRHEQNRIERDISRRLCTAAEAKLYFSNFISSGSGSANYLNPNKNCNLTSWLPGCEPGWACSVGQDVEVDLKNSKDIPARSLDCQPCCEGFFCPHGMTCMISCPLGSYCPLATLNKATGTCEPNHTVINYLLDNQIILVVELTSGQMLVVVVKYSVQRDHIVQQVSTKFLALVACFKLTSCNPNTANQNIHAYGIMLIVALSTLLLIIYNCSDQVLSVRERRYAKSREKAVRSVREKAQARERWISAKDAAKKHAVGLQNDDLYPPTLPITSSSSEQSSAAVRGKKAEPSDLMKRIYAIEEDPEHFDGLSFEVGDKNVKKKMPKEKQIHTHSQIFNYAYTKLEKEKALMQQNKNLTFSGVISMATNPEIRKRPIIEVSFRDLTITLKGKHKHLLRCVTGKIVPGRITAVMGPSGAGKTTFLSALAGKTVGCKMTGSILINGKAESMHSYRKIIGFVPQDDIVHGNLTVEENLWFTARCRLSADLLKPDKVLIVERVIESLGLQAVRDSLVGTVEKRGISGGQRKRVNVGLELVMEPSLLILDEPTSGLDSSSSQLLLRALRRESLEGVNICMVVHQPSYNLFKMFDDLILLAKGGLTVYHGPVKKVEEYFAGLGINVPERVNPPDHFIDVLEDIVKPSTSSGVNCRELPVRWMLHKGYPVPPDMQQISDELARSSVEVNLGNQINYSHTGTGEQSFAGEIWQDVMCNVELQRDIIRHNFLRSRDLSNRRTPGVFMQYKHFVGRLGKQRLREARIQAVDFLILLLAGACLGSIGKTSEQEFGAPGYTYTIIAVSLLCKIAALRSFSLDKLQYWRESASGISSLAHFLAKDTIDHFNTVIKPAVYLSMFYFFSNPRSSFAENYIVLLCLVYCVTGIGYTLAIFLEPGPSQLCAVLIPVVLTLIATQTGQSKFIKDLGNFCYPKWALEAFVVANAERYSGVWIITRCGSLMKMGYNLHDWGRCILFLVLAGVITRAIAFIGMVTFQRKK
ncbi:ABC transporter family protein [Actinidia rufa]|uniref:ABC transporter family protein n=1 Tax=Actinidia rufa TaxID=165716 RepID=A0A7J0GV58_9ERIC|nr:ABC transporter family protein [Actinidia rufa]